MTDRIEHEAEEYIGRIDKLGGMIEAIETGFVQNEIQRAAYQTNREIEEQKRIVVGVNAYRILEPEPPDLLRIDPKVQSDQISALNGVRSSRSGPEVKTRLDALRHGAAGTSNLMPLILDAVRAYASIGEICNTLRAVFGEYRERP
jgi:methylmalonyl-CoA mutase N-terminal domain/subunit